MTMYAGWVVVRDFLKKLGLIVAIGSVIAFVGLIIFWMFWVSNIDRHELGFSYDRMTGGIESNTNHGWWVRTPIRYSVHTIDLRPYQISISANQRILNAKLVRFNPAGLETFIAWHGRDAADSTQNMLEILKCYAFDRVEGRDCPFLEVVNEIAPPQSAEANQRVLR